MTRFSIILTAVALLIGGCGGALGRIGAREDEQGGSTLTQEELRTKLDRYQDFFEVLVRRACDELLTRDNSRQFKRLTLYWQMRILPMSRSALDQENPIGSLLDLATLCVRQQRYLENGDGRSLFGPHQDVALQAAKEASMRMHRLTASVFPSERLDEVRGRIQKIAEENPLRGEFSGSAVRVTEKGREDSVMQSMLSIPMAPFRWLGGVDHTAQAIKGFTVVAARLTEVVDGLAADARLHMQLLLLEAEDLEAVRSSLDSFAKLAASSERMAAVAESMPQNVRKELTAAFDDIDSKQTELRTTIHETRELAEGVDSAAQSLAAAADAIGTMVAGLQSKPPEATGGPQTEPGKSAVERDDGPGFDIKEYARVGETVEAAAKELRALAGEVDTVAQSEAFNRRLDDLDARLNRLLAETESKTAAVTDHAAWRLVQLAGVIFVLAVVYRWLARRFLPDRT